MTKLLIFTSFLIFAGCATIKETVSAGYDKVSCRIDCRLEDKEMDDSKDTCSCVAKESNADQSNLTLIQELMENVETMQERLTTLEKEQIACKPASRPEEVSLAPSAHQEPIKPVKKKSGDPLKDLLEE